MATYQLGTGARSGAYREIVCEQCGAGLGQNVPDTGKTTGLTADALIADWPYTSDAVRRHERTCPKRTP